MANNETEPLFMPAAICSLSAYIPGFIFLLTSNSTFLIATGLIWGTAVGLWAENGRRGGLVPWPRSWNEYKQMTANFYDKTN